MQSGRSYFAYVYGQLSEKILLSSATAILIFVQSVSTDAAHKRLSGQPFFNRQAIERLNERVRQTTRDTNLPVLHSSELISHTGTFGEQLTAALHAAFTLGFEQVLVIGNDCPALSASSLIQAAQQLSSASVVLGPDQRGGLYLFGLSREVFDRVSLASLPWRTSRLVRVIRRICAGRSVALLPRLGDINNRADLQQYRSASPATALFVALLQQLGTPAQVPKGTPRLIRLMGILAGIRLLRAPPTFQATAFAA